MHRMCHGCEIAVQIIHAHRIQFWKVNLILEKRGQMEHRRWSSNVLVGTWNHTYWSVCKVPMAMAYATERASLACSEILDAICTYGMCLSANWPSLVDTSEFEHFVRNQLTRCCGAYVNCVGGSVTKSWKVCPLSVHISIYHRCWMPSHSWWLS